MVFECGVNIADVWYLSLRVHRSSSETSTGLCEHCGEEESLEHVICVCQKYTNERENNEKLKMGVD